LLIIFKPKNILKKIFFIIIICLFKQDLYSQKEIIGKVEFYESEATKFLLFRDTNDNYTKNLNKRKSKVHIFQGDRVTEMETASGIFKFSVLTKDPFKIIVNKDSLILCEKFEFDSYEDKDTLKLKVSDDEFAFRLDSQREPEFQKKYSESQARIDFENGKINLLLMHIDWLKDEIRQRRIEVAQTYNIEYIYISPQGHSKMRIMYRYNKVIRDLLGIRENVW